MKLLISTLIFALLSSTQAFGASAEKERKDIREMRSEVLQRLYREEADTRDEIKQAAGYGVFSNVGINVIFFSAAGGNGVVRDNKTGKDIYMNMASAGLGIGMGVKDFRAVFVFHDRDAMNDFVEQGWDFSGQADAAAKSGKKGDEASGAATVIPGVTVYQLTESGLALQATLQGTKYWKSSKLNK
ncbi:MAG: YSC84-related protein [Candidatus Pelagadaptatus aseana]|uniref:lipid-binding SYLF domain-containing protein n=1 Tax=Candidatus Pelagadaptatus aseana TaxID=3120508 RepID=UPI0039B172A5